MNDFCSKPMINCYDNEDEKLFNQEELNTILAKDRRKHQQQLDELRAANETLTATNGSLTTEVEELTNHSSKIETAYNDLRVKTDDATIERSISDAASKGNAFSSDQLVALLKTHTSIIDGKVIVSVGGDELTPIEAIETMRETPEFQNLFKASGVGGIGGHSATGGLRPGRDSHVDIRKLSPSQYRQLRQTNPSMLGL